MSGELLITNLAELATPEGSASLSGSDQRRVRRIADAEILVRGGRIAFAGERTERLARFGELAATARLDGRRRSPRPRRRKRRRPRLRRRRPRSG